MLPKRGQRGLEYEVSKGQRGMKCCPNATSSYVGDGGWAPERQGASGYEDPDTQDGIVDTSDLASFRPPHLRVTSLCAVENWKRWSLDIKNTSPQVDGFSRDVFPQAPMEWELSRAKLKWELRAPAYGLNDALAACRRSPQEYLLNSGEPMNQLGLLSQVSTSDPCLYFS